MGIIIASQNSRLKDSDRFIKETSEFLRAGSRTLPSFIVQFYPLALCIKHATESIFHHTYMHRFARRWEI
jgi:hypothetical protein